MVHVYAAIREDVMSRQSLVSTMINGWRTNAKPVNIIKIDPVINIKNINKDAIGLCPTYFFGSFS
jgi:hypothetical protein